MSHPTRRPLVLACGLAVLSLALVLAASRWGWLGPDVGRGGQFCEAPSGGWVRQPVNTWSNLGFVAVGLLVAVHAGGRLRPGLTMGAHPGLATAYALLVVLLGPASMAMHATGTDLGGRIDQMSMFLLAGFAATYAVLRLLRLGPWFLGVGFPLAVLWAEGVRAHWWAGPALGFVGNAGNAAFGVLLGVVLVGELAVAVVHRRRARQDIAFGVAALTAFAGSFGVWGLGQEGKGSCDPHSLWQWHGVWHLGCAFAAYLLFRHFTGERGVA